MSLLVWVISKLCKPAKTNEFQTRLIENQEPNYYGLVEVSGSTKDKTENFG